MTSIIDLFNVFDLPNLATKITALVLIMIGTWMTIKGTDMAKHIIDRLDMSVTAYRVYRAFN